MAMQLYSSKGDHFIITDLLEAAPTNVFPFQCGRCGMIVAPGDTADAEDNRIHSVFNYSLYQESERDKDAQCTRVVCTYCLMTTIEEFPASSVGINNLRRLLTGSN